MLIFKTIFPLLIGLTGCVQDLGLSTTVDNVTEVVGTPDLITREVYDQALDILFVVDRSCSMSNDVERLTDSLPSIYEELISDKFSDLDWRVGVRTATEGFTGQMDRWVSWDDENIELKLSTLMSSNQSYMVSPERGLGAAVESMIWDNNFHRKKSDTLIIFISDENDSSSISVSSYENSMSLIKDHPFIITESSIVVTGDNFGCAGPEFIGDRYLEVSEVSVSICSEEHSWVKVLDKVKDHIPTLNLIWPLNHPPANGIQSIVVSIDEHETSEFAYDEASNSVILDYLPTTGSVVAISYIYL